MSNLGSVKKRFDACLFDWFSGPRLIAPIKDTFTIMRLIDVIAYQKKRIRSPWVWTPILALACLSTFGSIPSILSRNPEFLAPMLVAIALGSLGVAGLYIWLSPAPWFWTGTRARHAPLWRGAFQSLSFNVLFLGFVFGLQLVLLRKVPDVPGLNRGIRITNIGVQMLFHAVGSAVLGYFITLFERTRLVKEETEKKLREAHWVLLRGQLSPHVLFNSLNGLAELVHVDPDAAEKGILDLADLYRALLDHGSRPSAPLLDERNLVERYLSVENIRLAERLRLTWEWDAALETLETPPFLIQPLVENAIKHGIAPSPKGGELRIRLFAEGAWLVIRVENTGNALPLLLGNGVGVSNLEGRLFLAYGGGAKLRLYSENAWTLAEIRIQRELL